MRKLITLVSLYLFLSFSGCALASPKQATAEHDAVSVYDLSCERLTNPMGIDRPAPNLGWKLKSEKRDVRQIAYRILVASRPDLLDIGQADLWDSGRVESEASLNIRYKGKTLKSRDCCYWKVKTWSNQGETDWSNTQQWTVGILYFNEWRGRWIGFDRAFPWDDVSMYSRLSARYFRKELNVDASKSISRAHVFVMGLGLYELSINGNNIGNQVLAPSPTDYTKNVKYNSFDVTDALRKGDNVIGVILGNGRYFTMRQAYKPYKIKNFGFPKLLLNLFITYDDGSKAVIVTDTSWKGTADGPIRSNNEYDGEEYDARKEMPGWNRVGFNDQDWLPAEYVQEPGGDYQAQLNANMAVMDRLKPKAIWKLDEDRFILDMGQNMAGWLRMNVVGEQGTCVTLRFAESLDKQGELMTVALRDAKVTDRYTLKGNGLESWEPKFVYHGFRYVEISGYPGTPSTEDFEGCVVHDRMENIGKIETSNTLANQIAQNAYWSIVSNYKGVPIDCPQRNERMPWLGDRAAGCYGESFLLHNYHLYEKWLEDIRLTQKADGCLSDVAPAFFRYYSDNTTWPGVYLFVADMLYQKFGALEPVKEHYPHMKKWVHYMKDRYWVDGILTKDSYGDWCAPPKTIAQGAGKNANVKYPSELIATAYFYRCVRLMEHFALLTANQHDGEEFARIAELTREAFNRSYFNPEKGYYGKNQQTENLLALAFGMVPQAKIATVVESLRQSIVEEHNGHSSVGLIGAQWLMRTLSDHGMTDIAEQLLTNTRYPSWGYMVEQGATTIWELWNADTAAPNMNSQNHVMMLGDLLIWLFEDVGGIQSDAEHVGFKKIHMSPHFLKGLDFTKASYESEYGLIRSEWTRDASGKLTWEICIPPNTSAELHFPVSQVSDIQEEGKEIISGNGIHRICESQDKVVVEIGSGTYTFNTPGH